MPDPGEKARVEIEVAIRDMFSTTLKSMGRELDSMNKRAAELGQGGSSSFNRFRIENDRLSDSAKRSNVQLGATSSILSGITQVIQGPVGIVAAFAIAAQSLQSFATGRVQLQLFSNDVGLSAKQVNYWTQGMANMGISTEGARQNLSKLTGMIQEVNQIKEGSALSRLFVDMGSPEMAQKIQKNGGDINKSIDDILIKFRSMAPEAQGYFARQTGLTESVLKNLKEYADTAGKLYVSDFEHSKEYLKNMNNFQTELSNIWEKIKEKSLAVVQDNNAFDILNDRMKIEIAGIKEMYNDLSNFVKNQPFGKSFDFLNKTPGDFLRDMNPYRTPTPNESVKDRFGIIAPPSIPSGDSFKDRFGNWKKSEGTHSDITEFSGRRRDDPSLELETDSNKTLRDIRDTLQRMEVGEGGTYGTGIRTEGGAMQGGLGGFRGLTSRGHAGFGGRGSGRSEGGGGIGGGDEAGPAAANLEGLRGNAFLQKQRQSRIDEINKDPELKENVLKMLQLEEGSVTGKTGAMEALLNRSVMTGGTVKGELFSGFYGPINRGHLRDPLGDKARRSSQSAFDAAAAGSDLIQSRTDQGMIGDPNASGPGRIHVPGTSGIFNFWKGQRRGQQFSHERSAAWAAEQERQIREGGKKSMFRDSEVQFEGGDDAREQIDKTQSANQRVDANMSASVDFKNMPSWVKSSVDDNGKFKELRVTRSTPQAGKSEAGNSNSEFNSWAY